MTTSDRQINGALVTPNPHTTINVAIVGGGISGLCLALGILNFAPHVNIHIYEAAPRFAEIGAGVAFGINAQRALGKIDPRVGEAYAKLRTSNVDFNVIETSSDGHDEERRKKATYFRIVMGMDHASNAASKAGKEVCEIFCEGGMSSVHRARFLDEMVALLPDRIREKCVTFGAKLTNIEETRCAGSKGVKLTFSNGLIATADAVVGCDGIKSRVRQLLLGSDDPASIPRFTGKYAYRGLIPMDKAVATLGSRSAQNAHHRIGYDGHVLTFPIDKGKTMNVVAFRSVRPGTEDRWAETEEWVQPATKEEMKIDFKRWGDDVHGILDLMEKCDKWALFDHAPASTYHQADRICMIGDAAHASTPHQGSGAGMAVEDAFVLSGLLSEASSKDNLEQAFAAFEAMRKERTQRLVVSSREQAMIYDFQAPGIGDEVEKIAKVLPTRWDWIWDHDIEKQLAEAKCMMLKSKEKDEA